MARNESTHEQQCETARCIAEMQQTMGAARELVRHGAWGEEDYAAFCAEVNYQLAAAEHAPRETGKRGR